jgi:uncharacterized repeat protein (TIGR01451 family)
VHPHILSRSGVCALAIALLAPFAASADSYSAGSLIIPMDTTYQNAGMFRAYGLVYKLLSNQVPVEWIIEPTKAQGGVDFTATAKDFKTGASTGTSGYRGGPYVIPSAYRSAAAPIVQAWQAANTAVVVHEATATFTAPVSQHLVAAPNISVFADGKELIAFGYLNAAGIPQSNGAAWPTATDNSGAYPGQPDVLNATEIDGPTTTNHADGALLDTSAYPTYCHVLSMHYSAAKHDPEVVAEVRSYLSKAGTQYVGECQSATAFNNDVASGRFLTSGSISVDAQPSTVFVPVPSSPYIQFDGTFGTQSGSEPSWSETTRYPSTDILLKGTGSPTGSQEVVFSGFLDGDRTKGHALWIGGHEYTTTLPITSNPGSQGVRVILNGLLASPCSTAGTQPVITFGLSGPSFTTTAQATYTFTWTNQGQWPGRNAAVSYTLPNGVSFVSATGGGTAAGSTVSWTIGSLAPGATAQVSVTVNLGLAGTTYHQGTLTYSVGVTSFTMTSNTVATVLYAGPQALSADWIYTEPSGRLTDGLALADLASGTAGKELVVVAPTRGTSGPGRAIVLNTASGAELSTFNSGLGRNLMGLPLAEDLVAGGGLEYLTGEPLPVSANASLIARAGSSSSLWASTPYGYASYWNMGPASADVLSGSPGVEVLLADWDGDLRLLRGDTGAVLSSYNTWTSNADHAFGHPVLADVDGDGTLEAVVVGYSRGQVLVLNPEVSPTMTLQWSSAPLVTLMGDRPYGSGPAVGDLDGDGKPEIIVSTYGTTADVYAFSVAQAQGSTCRYRFHPGGRSTYLSPVVGDVDGSGTKSVVVMSSNTGTLSIFKAGAAGCTSGAAPVWQHQIQAGDVSSFTPVLYDVNGDGVLDVIAATNKRLEVIDVKNRVVLLYFTDSTAAFMPTAVIGDADGNGVRELYVPGWSNSKVYRLRLPAAATSTQDWPTFMGGNARTGAR